MTSPTTFHSPGVSKAPIWGLILCTALAGCGGGGSSGDDDSGSGTDNPPVTSDGEWYRPEVAISWQIQLQGTPNTGYDVSLYDLDLFDTPGSTLDDLHAAGRRVLCYFSGGSYESWRIDANQFASADLGQALDGWPGERWLDIRSEQVRTIMLDRLDLAVSQGCDGVDVDNMDGYANSSGFDLTANDQLDYNRFMADAAHQRGLAIALKNDLDQITQLVDHYDLAVNEQCYQYDECDLLTPFIDQGKPVLQIEYEIRYVNDTLARNALCGQSTSAGFSTLILPLELDDSYRFSCSN
ncbi:MAG: endo alpha-1,4 polygalactosaminidase [Candidatus Thiodiazotropha sp.]